MSTTPDKRRVAGGRRAGETTAEWEARVAHAGWVPACGGTERPFQTRTGRRVLYCVDLATGEHGYIDCDTDMPLTEDDQRAEGI